MGFDLTMRGRPDRWPDGFPGTAEGYPEDYRMRPHPMACMVALLTALGAVVEREAPSLPPWPPEGLSTERAEAIANGADATAGERALVDDWNRARDVVAGATDLDGVPSYKLQSNDGWIVQPDECRAIARALTACTVDEHLAMRMNAISDAIDAAVIEAFVAAGHDAPTRVPASFSVPELSKWFSEFATWNEMAATVGGYTVT